MSTSDEPSERDEILATLLVQAGIPVRDAEIAKLSQMYFDAEVARRTLRSPLLGETEPMIVFATEVESGSE